MWFLKRKETKNITKEKAEIDLILEQLQLLKDTLANTKVQCPCCNNIFTIKTGKIHRCKHDY